VSAFLGCSEGTVTDLLFRMLAISRSEKNFFVSYHHIEVVEATRLGIFGDSSIAGCDGSDRANSAIRGSSFKQEKKVSLTTSHS